MVGEFRQVVGQPPCPYGPYPENYVVIKGVDHLHHGIGPDEWRVEPAFTPDLPRRNAHPLVGRFGVRRGRRSRPSTDEARAVRRMALLAGGS